MAVRRRGPARALLSAALAASLAGCQAGTPDSSDSGRHGRVFEVGDADTAEGAHPSPSDAPADARTEEPADVAPVPGTGVVLVPPDGFAPAVTFAGFERPEDKATIIVFDEDGDVADVIRTLTSRAFSELGMKVRRRRNTEVDGHQAVMWVGDSTLEGETLRRIVVVVGSDTRIVHLEAVFPADLVDTLEDPAITALLDVRLVERPGLDLAGLPFAVEGRGVLELSARWGQMLHFHERGRPAPPDDELVPSGPFLIAGPLPLPPEELTAETAEAILLGEPLADMEIQQTEPYVVGEAAGLLTTATGTHPTEGVTYAVRQAIFVLDGVVIRFLGSAPPDDQEGLDSLMETIGTLRPAAGLEV